MTTSDLIWNLIMMLLDQINDSENEKETNEKDNQCKKYIIIKKIAEMAVSAIFQSFFDNI